MSRRQFRVPPRDSAAPPDDTGCTILHVDMDAFYASATLLSHPELRGSPVIIGGGSRGVVLSATYEARAFGVTSAMPMSRARRLCPQAIVLRPDHDRYAAISREVMATFREVTPHVEPLSLDEAFLDVSGAVRRLGFPATIAAQIRSRIESEQGITCSVGVAATKFIAKIASGLIKPDGLLVVPADETVSFVQQLPVGALWGVGERTEELLFRIGLRTVADIAQAPLPLLARNVGEASAQHLHDLAWGRDPRAVQPHRKEKSIGADETFAHDLTGSAEVRGHLLRLSEKVTSRMRAAGLSSQTISIKVRFSDFRTITRARTLREPTDSSREVFDTALDLFQALGIEHSPVRLVGVRAEKLRDTDATPIQGVLGEPEHGWRDADRAIDRATERFGRGSVRPASLLTGSPASHRSDRDLS